MAELATFHVDIIREETENQVSYDSDGNVVEGVSTDLILKWMSGGLSIITKELARASVSALIEEVSYEVTSTGEVPIPERAVGAGSLLKVEYYKSSTDKPYKLRIMPPSAINLEVPTNAVFPRSYFAINRVLRLYPKVTSGEVKITYRKALNGVDKKRGTIASIERSSDLLEILSISLEDDANLDAAMLARRGVVSAVNGHGEITGYSLNYSDYNSSTRTLTLSPSWEIGEAKIAVGDYVVAGAAHSTHFDTSHEIAELAIIYAKAMVLAHDADPKAEKEEALFQSLLQSLVMSYQETTEDPEFFDETTDGYEF